MIVLIAGTTHTGKTMLAQRLLERYGYPYLSIDHLKMGLIRSRQTSLTPEQDGELTAYLWPIVREMVKTAVENRQNLIVEGCYIPFDWQAGFEPAYLAEIRYVCLVMSERYIRSHFDDILAYASVIESRGADSGCEMEMLIADNRQALGQCRARGLDYIWIDGAYRVELDLEPPAGRRASDLQVSEEEDDILSSLSVPLPGANAWGDRAEERAVGALPTQARQVAGLLRELLGDGLVGVYLSGSAMLGGLRPDSDVDLFVLTRARLSEAQRTRLTEGLLRLSGRVGEAPEGGRRPLEVTVAARPDVVPQRFPAVCDYQYGEWLRQGLERGALSRAALDPDLTLLLWQVRAHSLPLLGSPAEQVLPPQTTEHIRAAIRQSLPGLTASLHGDERNVLLTLARMWVTLETGALVSKDAAAAWAAERLPAPLAAMLEMARLAYLGQCRDDWRGREAEADALAAALAEAVGQA